MRRLLLLSVILISFHVNKSFAQCEAIYDIETNRLDSIYSRSDNNVLITDNKTRIFLWILAYSDTNYKYNLPFCPDEPLVMEKEEMGKIIFHLKKEKHLLQNRIDTIVKRKLGNWHEIKELPQSENLADFYLASFHLLNPDFGLFDFKSLCKHYIDKIKSHSIDKDFYLLSSTDEHFFIGVLSLINGDEPFSERSWNPAYRRINKIEFEKLTAWCVNNYSNTDAINIFYNTYCDMVLSAYLYHR